MMKYFLICLLFFVFSCKKDGINTGLLNIILDLSHPDYVILQQAGVFGVFPLSPGNLYIKRIDTYAFRLFDLTSPNLDLEGNPCELGLDPSPDFLTDRCIGVQYNILTGSVVPASVPQNLGYTPGSPQSYNYVFDSDALLLFIE